MEPKTKQNLLLITIGIALFAALNNFPIILQFIGKIIDIATPLIIGGIVAFILSVPTNGFLNLLTKLSKKFKRKLSAKTLNTLSVALTLISLVGIIAAVMVLVIPGITESINIIIGQIQEQWPEWMNKLSEQGINTKTITEYLEKVNFEDYTSKITSLINDVVGTTSSVISIVLNIVFSIITAFYFLLFRKDLERQVKKLIYAVLKENIADKIIDIAKTSKNTYSKFLTGQCKESLIIGLLMFITLSVLKLSYSGLIAILTFILAFIPYVGTFISYAIGALLVLLGTPEKIIIYLIAYPIVQFIENQFIYPKVVGKSVGMSPVWTFMAVLIGGKLFGIVGILFFIPFTAVLYYIVGKNVDKKLKEKKLMIK